MTRLAALPADLERIISAKKARLACRGVAALERAAREKDIHALELARRIAAFVAKYPEEFEKWYRSRTGGELLG